MLSKKMKLSILTGALLGVVCIIGAGVRMGYQGNTLYLFALWYNRVIMGILIGLSSISADTKGLLKGGFLGLLVSLAFYLSTGLSDFVTFAAGIVYGVIIAYVIRKYD